MSTKKEDKIIKQLEEAGRFKEAKSLKSLFNKAKSERVSSPATKLVAKRLAEQIEHFIVDEKSSDNPAQDIALLLVEIINALHSKGYKSHTKSFHDLLAEALG